MRKTIIFVLLIAIIASFAVVCFTGCNSAVSSGKNTDSLVIACKGGTAVELVTVQPEGSKPMTAKQMLCGRPIATGTVIGCE